MFQVLTHTVNAYLRWGHVALRSRLGLGKDTTRSPAGRRMLLLAWRLPPSVTGGVYRPCSFLKYGSQNGWEVSAIAGPPELTVAESGQWLLDQLPAQTKICRVDKPRLRPAWNWFPRVNGGFLNALAVASLAYIKFHKRPPTVVLASGPPFHNFIAAFYIARYFGAKLMLDYRDEWTVGTRAFIRLGNRDSLWESFCLRRADAVIFATKGFKEIYLRNVPGLDAKKMRVVTNGWDSDDFSELEKLADPEPKAHKHYVISFVGRCGKFLAPDSFLATLDRLLTERPELVKQFRVRFIGRQFPEARETLNAFSRRRPDILELIGEVPKPVALRAMKESSCLLLLNNLTNERVRAGKLYEYIAAGPPILVYGNGRETEELVTRLDLGPVVPEDHLQALDQALSDLIKGRWHSGVRPGVDDWLARHTREALAQCVFAIADKLSRNAA